MPVSTPAALRRTASAASPETRTQQSLRWKVVKERGGRAALHVYADLETIQLRALSPAKSRIWTRGAKGDVKLFCRATLGGVTKQRGWLGVCDRVVFFMADGETVVDVIFTPSCVVEMVRDDDLGTIDVRYESPNPRAAVFAVNKQRLDAVIDSLVDVCDATRDPTTPPPPLPHPDARPLPPRVHLSPQRPHNPIPLDRSGLDLHPSAAPFTLMEHHHNMEHHHHHHPPPPPPLRGSRTISPPPASSTTTTTAALPDPLSSEVAVPAAQQEGLLSVGLDTSRGCNELKWRSGDALLGMGVGEARVASLRSFAAAAAAAAEASLQQAHPSGGGGFLHEISQHIRFPAGVSPAAALRRQAKGVVSQAGVPGMLPLEALLIRILTQEGPDIDRLVGFPDAPTPGQGPAWRSYERVYRGQRNSSLNEALCEAACLGASAASQGRVPSQAHPLHSYANLLCYTFASGKPLPTGSVLYRPCCCSPATLGMLRGLSPGAVLSWAAPVSCTTEMGLAAAALPDGEPYGNVLFIIAGPIRALRAQKFSQYPIEMEYILPPLAVLKVSQVRQGLDYLAVEVTYRGGAASGDDRTERRIRRLMRELPECDAQLHALRPEGACEVEEEAVRHSVLAEEGDVRRAILRALYTVPPRSVSGGSVGSGGSSAVAVGPPVSHESQEGIQAQRRGSAGGAWQQPRVPPEAAGGGGPRQEQQELQQQRRLSRLSSDAGWRSGSGEGSLGSAGCPEGDAVVGGGREAVGLPGGGGGGGAPVSVASRTTATSSVTSAVDPTRQRVAAEYSATPRGEGHGGVASPWSAPAVPGQRAEVRREATPGGPPLHPVSAAAAVPPRHPDSRAPEAPAAPPAGEADDAALWARGSQGRQQRAAPQAEEEVAVEATPAAPYQGVAVQTPPSVPCSPPQQQGVEEDGVSATLGEPSLQGSGGTPRGAAPFPSSRDDLPVVAPAPSLATSAPVSPGARLEGDAVRQHDVASATGTPSDRVGSATPREALAMYEEVQEEATLTPSTSVATSAPPPAAHDAVWSHEAGVPPTQPPVSPRAALPRAPSSRVKAVEAEEVMMHASAATSVTTQAAPPYHPTRQGLHEVAVEVPPRGPPTPRQHAAPSTEDPVEMAVTSATSSVTEAVVLPSRPPAVPMLVLSKKRRSATPPSPRSPLRVGSSSVLTAVSSVVDQPDYLGLSRGSEASGSRGDVPPAAVVSPRSHVETPRSRVGSPRGSGRAAATDDRLLSPRSHLESPRSRRGSVLSTRSRGSHSPTASASPMRSPRESLVRRASSGRGASQEQDKRLSRTSSPVPPVPPAASLCTQVSSGTLAGREATPPLDSTTSDSGGSSYHVLPSLTTHPTQASFGSLHSHVASIFNPCHGPPSPVMQPQQVRRPSLHSHTHSISRLAEVSAASPASAGSDTTYASPPPVPPEGRAWRQAPPPSDMEVLMHDTTQPQRGTSPAFTSPSPRREVVLMPVEYASPQPAAGRAQVVVFDPTSEESTLREAAGIIRTQADKIARLEWQLEGMHKIVQQADHAALLQQLEDLNRERSALASECDVLRRRAKEEAADVIRRDMLMATTPRDLDNVSNAELKQRLFACQRENRRLEEEKDRQQRAVERALQDRVKDEVLSELEIKRVQMGANRAELSALTLDEVVEQVARLAFENHLLTERLQVKTHSDELQARLDVCEQENSALLQEIEQRDAVMVQQLRAAARVEAGLPPAPEVESDLLVERGVVQDLGIIHDEDDWRVVADVVPNSPAGLAGVSAGALIVAVDRVTMEPDDEEVFVRATLKPSFYLTVSETKVATRPASYIEQLNKAVSGVKIAIAASDSGYTLNSTPPFVQNQESLNNAWGSLEQSCETLRQLYLLRASLRS